MSALRYQDDHAEVFISGGGAVVHDKQRDRYYRAEPSSLPRAVLDSAAPAASRVSATAAFAFLSSGVALLALNIVFSIRADTSPTPWFLAWFVPYIVLSVVVHEFAHLAALRFLGRRHDKVGFRMHYIILPAFYVRMNQSVLLFRDEKVIVHAAGIWVNLLINAVLIAANALFFRSGDLEMALIFAVITLACNAVPALNSDGYRVLLALAGINELKERKRNPLWIRCVKVASWILVACYGIYISIDIYLGIMHG
ncbi:zinc metalloprotease [Nocardiopsis ganjiahuensis]|uniref:hypothetical protein n=1 Tax=Nocardiopsis ganjiahuensis TaxID=239984 RepID=UPI00034B8D4A|nr:hypothetical protein [Nocardiopsis ganjiahuensis]